MNAEGEQDRGLDLGFVMVWVSDVKQTVAFYEAIGLKKRFYVDTEDGGYAEFGTELGGAGSDAGTTRLVFSGSREAKRILPEGVAATPKAQHRNPVQLRFVIDDVQATYDTALRAGAQAVSGPELQAWGVTLARFRDPNGILVSLVSRLPPQQQARRLHELAGTAAIEALRAPQNADQVSLQDLPLGQPAGVQGSDQLEELLRQVSDEDLARVFTAGRMADMEAAIIARL